MSKQKHDQKLIEVFLNNGGKIKKYEESYDTSAPYQGTLTPVSTIKINENGKRIYSNLNRPLAYPVTPHTSY